MNYVGIIITFYIIQLLLVVPCNVAAQTGGSSSSSTPSEDQYMTDDTLKVSPGMAILLAGLVTTFFMMGCVSVYARRCVDAWSESTRGGGGLPIHDISRRSGRTRHGLDPNVIDTFPTFLYSDVKGLKIGKSALECAVCLNEFEDKATLRLLPKCCHVFHTECIDMWLVSHVTCPVCRADLVPAPGEEPTNNHYLPFSGSPYSTRSPDVRGQPVNEICELQNDSSIGSPEVINFVQSRNPNEDHKDTPKSPPVVWKLPRSYSTGHSLVQPGQDHERFTLRLPEGVHQMLKNSDLRRVATNATCTFPTERSPKRWFRRSNSFGTGRGSNNNVHYERFNQETRPDRWEFSITPPFVSRSKSVQSPSTDLSSKITASGSLIKTVKSPFDQLFSEEQTDDDDVGERSFTRLTGNNRPV